VRVESSFATPPLAPPSQRGGQVEVRRRRLLDLRATSEWSTSIRRRARFSRQGGGSAIATRGYEQGVPPLRRSRAVSKLVRQPRPTSAKLRVQGARVRGRSMQAAWSAASPHPADSDVLYLSLPGEALEDVTAPLATCQWEPITDALGNDHGGDARHGPRESRPPLDGFGGPFRRQQPGTRAAPTARHW